MPLRLGFLGVGGLGGWLAGRALQAKTAGGDVEVVLIARGSHGAALREKGLRLRVRTGGDTGPVKEELHFPPEAAEVYNSAAAALEAGARPLDCLLLCVKTWQVREAAAEALELLGPKGFVVTTQNGVEAPDQAALAAGPERVLGGIARVLAFLAEPGTIEMQDQPCYFRFGEVFAAGGGGAAAVPTSPRVEELAGLFAACKGVDSGIATPSTWEVLWDKAMTMCSMGPVAALCRAPISTICTVPETGALLEAAILEVALCAEKAGHRSAASTPEEQARQVRAMLSRASPGLTPSTLRDVVTGKPSELHELTGGIRRAGRKLGVATPTHDLIYAALLPQERRARGEEPYVLMGVPGGVPHVSL